VTREVEKSRSQVKREFAELKKLGIQLAALSKEQLGTLPLSEETRAALLAAKGMSRGPLQRQYRYLSSLLASEDVAALRAALIREQQPHAAEVAAVHRAERWRDRLLCADEGQLVELVGRFPECDRTPLLELVQGARKEHDLGKPPRSARQLFRYLRQLPSVGGLSGSQVEDEEFRT
jgi:ribosome-associated protein